MSVCIHVCAREYNRKSGCQLALDFRVIQGQHFQCLDTESQWTLANLHTHAGARRHSVWTGMDTEIALAGWLAGPKDPREA